MLNLVVPTGSLEPQVLKLFEEADLPILRANERDYAATINDPRVQKVKFLRPPEIPGAVQDGHFDLGLCETHSIREARAEVAEVMDLGPGGRSRGGHRTRVILAIPGSSGVTRPEELPAGVRVATEF